VALGADDAIPPWPTRPDCDLLAQDRADRPIGILGPLVVEITDDHVVRLQSRFVSGETAGTGVIEMRPDRG